MSAKIQAFESYGAWGVEQGGSRIYDPAFSKRVAQRVAALLRRSKPPEDWEATREILVNEGFDEREFDVKQVIHRIKIATGGGENNGQYLREPADATEVRRRGYGFTADQGEAWEFNSKKLAETKVKVLIRHFQGGTFTFSVESEVQS